MKRVDISRLRKYYGMKFQFGLMISMAFVLSAFNYTIYPEEYEPRNYELEQEDQELQVIRTVFTPKKAIVKPPKIEIAEVIEIDEPEFIEEKKPEVIAEVVEVSEIEDPIPEAVVVPKKVEKPVVLPEEPKLVVPEIFDGYQVEEMPRFNACEGGDLDTKEKQLCALKALKMFLRDELDYPRIAVENGIEGTAVIQFIVEKDGSISNLKIKHDPGAGLGAEAFRVSKAMPNWIPGKQRGRPVRVRFTLPVKFKLN